MPDEGHSSVLARYITAKATLVVVCLAAAAVTVTAFPAKDRPGLAADPTADAEAAYRALTDRLAESGATLEGAVSGAQDTAERGGHREAAAQLGRDLFAPLPARRSGALSFPRRASGLRVPSPPRLQGIFIDGASRHAALADSIVAEGDSVRGYKVLEIAPRHVILQRGNAKTKLVLGGKR